MSNAWAWPPLYTIFPGSFPVATPTANGLESAADKFMSPLWPIVSVCQEILFASGDVTVIPAPAAGFVHVVKSGTGMLYNSDATAGFRAIWKSGGITLQDSGTGLTNTAGQATNNAQLVFGQVLTAAATLALSASDGTKGVMVIDYEVQPAALWIVANLNLTTAFQTVPLTIPAGYAACNVPSASWLVAPASHSMWVSNNDGAARTVQYRLTRGAIVMTIDFPNSYPQANQTRTIASGSFASLITGDVLEVRVTALTTAGAVRFGYNGRLVPLAV